ncbi:CBS domain-containing protein [Candidatus Micrarchaeota archaeon]|nr:CBS domain-containing protein [Candidatus Micrarchaeota archaeon]
MKAKELISGEVYMVGPNDSIAHVRNMFMKHKTTRLLVYDGKPIGVITQKDLSDAYSAERTNTDALHVSDVMTRKVLSVDADDPVVRVVKMMQLGHVSGLAVQEKGEVIGEVTKKDLVRYFAENHKGEVQVKDLMTKDVKTITESHSVFHAAKIMKKHGVGRLVVMNDNKIEGIISEGDISMFQGKAKPTMVTFIRKTLTGLSKRSAKSYPTTVGELMHENVISVREDADAAQAARMMLDKKVGSILVVENNAPKGIISKSDIVNHLASCVKEGL